MRWNGIGLANFSVQIREWTLPPQPDVIYASGLTDASGRFTITGLPTKGNLSVHLPEQSGYNMVGFGIYTTCGDRVVAFGDHPVSKLITSSIGDGLDPITVPAGPLTLSWDSIPSTTTYCVTLGTLEDQSPTTGVCGGYLGQLTYTTATTHTTRALIAGKDYWIVLRAFAGENEIGKLRYGSVSIRAR